MGNPEYSTTCIVAEMSEILTVGVSKLQKEFLFLCQMEFAMLNVQVN